MLRFDEDVSWKSLSEPRDKQMVLLRPTRYEDPYTLYGTVDHDQKSKRNEAFFRQSACLNINSKVFAESNRKFCTASWCMQTGYRLQRGSRANSLRCRW